MREYIEEFCTGQAYPAEAQEALLAAYAELAGRKQCMEHMERWQKAYRSDVHMDYGTMLGEIRAMCEAQGMRHETVSMLYFIGFSRHTRILYRQSGLSEELWLAAMEDLKWKLLECHKVKGIWGSFVSFWFDGFFTLNRFTLGRLQYELFPFPENYTKCGRKNPAELTQVVNVHIPSSGPLTREKCMESFAAAYEFYKNDFPDREVAFYCHSWMLSPVHVRYLPETSHIREFMEYFDIFRWSPEPSGGDLWRIFGLMDCSDTSNLPEETSLQRDYKRLLLDGECIGEGEGLFFMGPDGMRKEY